MNETNESKNDRNQRVEAAYIEFKRSLERLANGITRNQEDSEDVVHDVFLNLLEMEPFPPDFDRNPKAYLHQSAFNRALNVLKSRNNWRPEDLDFVELLAPSPESGADPATVRRLRKAMAELDPETAAMLILHYEEGYNTAEIAQMKGTSPDAVCKTLSRTEGKLKRLIRIQERDVELQKTKRQIEGSGN